MPSQVLDVDKNCLTTHSVQDSAVAFVIFLSSELGSYMTFFKLPWGLLLLTSFAIIAGVIAFSKDYVNAQITPDATLGNERSVVTPNIIINGLPSDRIDGGAIRGSNLFHSFSEFNIGNGRGAYFTNPNGNQNILSRVTGNNLSNILGTLGVTGGNTNLFFINPNGIVFEPNATLDVQGSFVATTANAIEFGENGFFSATASNLPSALLTVNPSAFLFNQIAMEAISLSMLGQSLLMVGRLSILVVS